MNENIEKFEDLLGIPKGTIKKISESTEEEPFDFEAVATRYLEDQEAIITTNKAPDVKKIGDEAVENFKIASKKKIIRGAGMLDQYTDKEIKEMKYDDVIKGLGDKIEAKVQAKASETDETIADQLKSWKDQARISDESLEALQVKYDTDMAAKDAEVAEKLNKIDVDNYVNSHISGIKIAPSLNATYVTKNLKRDIDELLIVDYNTGEITGKDGKPYMDGNNVLRDLSEFTSKYDEKFKISEQSFGAQQPTGSDPTLNITGKPEMTEGQKAMLAAEGAPV